METKKQSKMNPVRYQLFGDTKVVETAEGYIVGKIYKLQDGYHQGNLIRIISIDFSKKMIIDGKKYRKAHGMIITSQLHINFLLKDLKSKIKIVRETPMSEKSNPDIVKLARLGDRLATQEFVRRFKRKPKFTI